MRAALNLFGGAEKASFDQDLNNVEDVWNNYENAQGAANKCYAGVGVVGGAGFETLDLIVQSAANLAFDVGGGAVLCLQYIPKTHG